MWCTYAQLLSNLHTPNEKKENRKQTVYANKHLRYVLCRWPIKTKWNWLSQRRLRQHPLMPTKWPGPGPQPGPLRWGRAIPMQNWTNCQLHRRELSEQPKPAHNAARHNITQHTGQHKTTLHVTGKQLFCTHPSNRYLPLFLSLLLSICRFPWPHS